MNETFFSQNGNELTSEYQILEKEADATPAKDAQALQHVASKGENGQDQNDQNEDDGENRGDENNDEANYDEENYDILNMLNEIKKDVLYENEKLQQQSSQNVHITEGDDGDKADRNAVNQTGEEASNQHNHASETKNTINDNIVALAKGQCGEEVRVPNRNKTEENPKKLPKKEPQVEEEPLEKQLNSSDAQVKSQGAAPNEQSHRNVSIKKSTGRPSKKPKNIPSDAKSTPFLSKEPSKKRKAKNGPDPQYAALAMHPLYPAHRAHLANLAKVTKTNNPLIDDEIEYLTNCEFVTQNYLKEIEKKRPRVKSHSINIDIFYSSRSEKSTDESEKEAEVDSSIDSIEEFYENICQSDVPLDFYKNSLSAKQGVKEVQPEYFLNTENSVTEEIQILNRYIKDMTEGQQKNSSYIDVDNKLVNILSLSFLTFIDHVIYDSHIYALKSEFTQGGETDKGKKSTTDEIATPNGNSQNECLDEEAAPARTKKINIVGRNAPNGANLQNEPGKDNPKMSPPKEKLFSMKNAQDAQSKEPPRSVDVLDNPDQVTRKEAVQNDGVSAREYGAQCTPEYAQGYPPERDERVGTEIIYTPEVINLCLTNLYNQELVSKIMKQKMSEGDASGACADNLKDSALNTNKLIHNHTIAATAQPGKSEKTHLEESANEMHFKNGGLLKSKDSLQTNINHKLNKRQIIINKINEKIKKKSINSLQSCVNTKKYSLDDLFEL
ncbi:hypothetical protein C922_04995 [Plasmodium inui San Antonio 1]|uniref:Uncharacterized protein n=1 Tax=Plasmodium inui San Antonio 1 TaxID=1237626 RepID=W7A6C9_9APIC|nr:hypothetical protein C922_04995 [Plasmodium inui San Antonio 1]EUD64649.1 hypothetical protein C922_04995 [Plasmodium inui San Antonio 1]